MHALATKQDEKPRHSLNLREDRDRWRTEFENAQRPLPVPTVYNASGAARPAGERRCRLPAADSQNLAAFAAHGGGYGQPPETHHGLRL